MNDAPDTIRALLVDDEQLARKYLVQMLDNHPEIEVVGQCANGFEAVKSIATLNPDLVFLDIQMPKLDGFEVLELVNNQPAVVFVTAYEQYALDAFDAHAVDYLLKPFSPERLVKALDKVKKNLGKNLPPVDDLRHAIAPKKKFIDRIVVKDGTSIEIIPTTKVEYIQAEDDYVSIHSLGKDLLKHQTISSLEKSLDPKRFVRIHRSSLINVEFLSKIEPFTKDRQVAIMKDDTELSISRSGLKRLKQILE